MNVEIDPPDDEEQERLFGEALNGYSKIRVETAQGLAHSGILGQLVVREHVVGFVQQSLKVLGTHLATLPSHEQKACCAGCAFCCYQRIDVTALEALAIAGCLELTRSEDELLELRERLAATAERVQSLTKAQHAREQIACAFLSEDQFCTVHPVRPIPCAGWHSMSRESCEEALQRGDPAETGVPLDMHALLQAKGYWFGLSDALRRQQLDAERYELHSAVSRALEIPDAAGRWLSGEAIFTGCTPGQADADTVIQYANGDNQKATLRWEVADDGAGRFVFESGT